MTAKREVSALRGEIERSSPGAGVADPQAGSDGYDVSIIIPLTERAEPLPELIAEYADVVRRSGRSFEVLIVAHPHFARELSPVPPFVEEGEPVRVIETGRSVGETALLRLGLANSSGRIILTIPPYRQVQPEAVLDLLQQVEDGTDLAVARRWPRVQDAWVNRFQNRVLHSMVGPLAGDRIHDVACGVRAVRRDVLQGLPLYGEFGRFLPLLALYNGYSVGETDSPQHPNDRRPRVYRPGIYLRRLIDVLGLFFLLRFTDKPLRFFGLIGSGLAAPGALLLLVLVIQRAAGRGIADRPLLLLSVLLITLGVQAVALGLIGEMIVHFNAPRRRIYRLLNRERGTN
ncbi:MAG TPA: glycosyltransferase [Gemmatimonadaceae bacterium]|nr:glycosyltransferase [Gemmatimonadaceae bacterium]